MASFPSLRALQPPVLLQSALVQHVQRRTAMKRSSRGSAFQGGRTPKHRGIRKQDGQCVKAGTVIVRQVGKVFYPGQHVKRGRDYSLMAECEGFVRFYWDRKHGPNQISLSRKKVKRYCGLVFHPEDQLPRDLDKEGRARRFSSLNHNEMQDYLRDKGGRSSSDASYTSYSDMPPPPDPFVRFTTEDAAESDTKEPGPMTQRELDIADLIIKRKGVAPDGLPIFNNVRRALGMPLKPVHANALDKAARRELRELEPSRNKAERSADRDLAFSTVSSSEMQALRLRESSLAGVSRRALPSISTGA